MPDESQLTAATDPETNTQPQPILNIKSSLFSALYFSFIATTILPLAFIIWTLPQQEYSSSGVDYFGIAIAELFLFLNLFVVLLLKVSKKINIFFQILILAILPVITISDAFYARQACKSDTYLACIGPALGLIIIVPSAVVLFVYYLFATVLFDVTQRKKKTKLITILLFVLIILVEMVLISIPYIQKAVALKQSKTFSLQLKTVKESEIRINTIAKTDYDAVRDNNLGQNNTESGIASLNLQQSTRKYLKTADFPLAWVDQNKLLFIRQLENPNYQADAPTKSTESLWVKDISSGKETVISGDIQVSDGVAAMGVAISPNKSQLAVIALHNLYIVNTDGSGWFKIDKNICSVMECRSTVRYGQDGIYFKDTIKSILDGYISTTDKYYKIVLPKTVHTDN